MATEVRQVAGFDKIELKGTGHLHLEQGAREALRVEAPQEVLDQIVTEVKDGILQIYFHKKWYEWILSPTVSVADFYITVRDLKEVRIAGAGSIRSTAIKAEELKVIIKGAANADIAVAVSRLECRLAGSGELKLSGTAEKQEVEIGGAGKYEAKALASREATVKISGVGNAALRVAEKLKVKIAGTGEVSYLGDPVVEQSVSGVGRVMKAAG